MSADDHAPGATPGSETNEEDPDDGDAERHHAFWADEVADRVEARNPDEPIVIKGGVTPSGVPHIGHVNEIIRGYYVAEALRDRGWEVRQVFTSDDKDPLRGIPHRLMDLDWNVVERGEFDVSVLGKNLGKPLTDVPDPFGCCDSFGAHQTKLLEESAEMLGISVEFRSNTELIAEGAYDAVVQYLLEHADEAREVLAEYQDKVDDDYYPFKPQCANCGILTEGVTSVDVEAGEVHYVCEDVEAGNRTIQGCGHEGTASFREGQLTWRFNWPAQWQVFDVDFEPFGKDHAEGSWPSGKDVAENVLGIEPPEPMVYEWFTLNGAALSSSSGNVITVEEVLDLVEPEVFRYFFAKNPRKARDFDVEHVDQLVDEFDRFERDYFGERESTDREAAFADRAYPMVTFDSGEGVPRLIGGEGRDGLQSFEEYVEGTDADPRSLRSRYLDEVYRDRVRIPYRFAAVLGMTDDPALREDIARREGHVPEDAPRWAVDAGLERVERARRWARRTENEYDYELKRTEMPAVEFDEDVAAALDDLADFVAEGHTGEEIQGEIYETAKRHDVDVGDFFGAGYRLFFDDDEGPRLGEFLGDIDREFVVERLRREG